MVCQADIAESKLQFGGEKSGPDSRPEPPLHDRLCMLTTQDHPKVSGRCKPLTNQASPAYHAGGVHRLNSPKTPVLADLGISNEQSSLRDSLYQTFTGL
jgi:hypothetical protein